MTAVQIAQAITGDDYPANFSKRELIVLMRERGMEFFVGMDWGFSHNFAVVTAVRDGARLFVIDSFEIPELDPAQKIEICNDRIKPWNPTVYADPESPADIKLFRRNGFKMRAWKKGKGSVKEGIDAVRIKILPVLSQVPELFFIKNDLGVDSLFNRMCSYHWRIDPAGNIVDPPQPDEHDDDAVDALRYLIMNVFKRVGGISVDAPANHPTAPTGPAIYAANNWMAAKIREEVIGDGVTFDPLTGQPIAASVGRNGGVSWDL
jgi:hypothetical protein